MELNKIQSSGSWGKAADDLNQNFAKVNNAVEQVKNATTRNKGYFSTDTALKSALKNASLGDIAYVGSAYPYQTWAWNGTEWEKKNDNGGQESVNLGNYYTKEDTDKKLSETDAKLSELGQIVLPIKSWTEASNDSKIKDYYGKTISNNGNLVDDSSYAYYTNVYVVSEKSRYKIAGRTYSGKTELAAFYNSDTVFDSSTLISIVPYEVTGNPTDIDQIVTAPNGAKAVAVCQYYNTGALPYDQQLKFYIEVSGDGMLDRVGGLEKDVAENTKSIKELNDKFSKFEDFTGGESYNLYDKSKQTPETISPHYYVNGKPYTTTQFDASYNCTAMFELEQDTEYTIGLVPPYGYEKPWADAANGIFFYDKEGVYISGTSNNTFVTPSGTKYARFNYAIIKYITLGTVNARCMIVKGSQLPSEYVPYESSNFIEKVEELEQKIGELEVGAGVMYYEIKTDEINIFQKNGTNLDVAFVLKRKGGNNLFDFYQVLKYSNESDILETDVNKYSPIITSGTDWHAPFKVLADNNADGDNKNTNGGYNDFFTGGNHQYNNNGSGSTPTAKSISLMFYADGKRVNKGDKGYASSIRMEWANEVQGQNTTKADGSGRFILQENHVLTYDGSRFFSHVELVALEDIHINLWYGFQALYQNVFNKIRFVDTTNRGVYSLPSSSNCGSISKCKGMYLYGDGISLKMEVDDTFDLGKREFNNISYAAFSAEYGKVYFGIVYTSQFAVKTDEMYVLEGGYEFKLS